MGPFTPGGKGRATLPAVFLTLFEENWAVLGLSLVAWVVVFYLFIHSFKFESKVGLKAVCCGCF